MIRTKVTTLLVAILAILPLGIVWFAYVTTGSTLEKVESAFAKDIFRSATADVADLAAEYVSPLAATAQIAASHLATYPADPGDPVTDDAYLRTTLEHEPRVVSIGWYRSDGAIREVRRDGTLVVSRSFDPHADAPVVTTTWRTSTGVVVSESTGAGPLAAPDPLVVARARNEATAVSAAAPSRDGVTQSVMFAAASTGDQGGTVLVEADLTQLGSFIGQYAPTASSRVFIVAGPNLVTHARPELIGRAPSGSTVASLSDPVTTAAAHLVSGGEGWQLLKINGTKFHAVSRRIHGINDLDWTVIMIGPEADFAGQFFELRRSDTVALGVIAAIAILLALPLARLAMRDMGSLHTAAHRDSLTGLLNRRTFEKFGSTLIATARRRRRSVGALMVDIDHFKQLNDTYGHHAGDEILEAIAGRISHSVAKTDLVARLGGDEMALLLEGADLAASRSVATRLKNAVTATPISTHRGPVYVTVSIGASATGALERARLDDVLKAADRALYASKRAGRDRITAVEMVRTH